MQTTQHTHLNRHHWASCAIAGCAFYFAHILQQARAQAEQIEPSLNGLSVQVDFPDSQHDLNLTEMFNQTTDLFTPIESDYRVNVAESVAVETLKDDDLSEGKDAIDSPASTGMNPILILAGVGLIGGGIAMLAQDDNDDSTVTRSTDSTTMALGALGTENYNNEYGSPYWLDGIAYPGYELSIIKVGTDDDGNFTYKPITSEIAEEEGLTIEWLRNGDSFGYNDQATYTVSIDDKDNGNYPTFAARLVDDQDNSFEITNQTNSANWEFLDLLETQNSTLNTDDIINIINDSNWTSGILTGLELFTYDEDAGDLDIPGEAITTNLQYGEWIVTGDLNPAATTTNGLGAEYQAGDQGAGLISFIMATPLANHTYPSAINTINSLEVVDLSGKGTYESAPVGEIPSSIGDLSNLEYLTLDANSYTGNIPEEISKLTELIYLKIYDTSVENFPTEEIVGLENLETLIFRSNLEAEGTVTSEIFELPNLKTVEFVGNNILKGEFSTNEIVYNDSMSRVEIAYQAFTGIIDESILDWEALNDIFIYGTNISVDPSPNEIGQKLDEAGVCSVTLMNGDSSDIYENDGAIYGC